MATQVKRQLFTVEDYYKMAEVGILKPTDRVELINGEIIQMSPIKSLHASVVTWLGEELNFQLRGKATVRIQNPIRIDTYSEPEPDIAVVKYKKDKYRNQHPTGEDVYLVIEVADTTLMKDRTIKKQLYAAVGIPEYWIINLKAKQIEVYRQPSGKGYTIEKIAKTGETLAAQGIDFEVEVGEVF